MAMKVIAVSNGKGGVGKTHLSVHLATGLSEGHQVLYLDFDWQGNGTKWVTRGIPGDRSVTAFDLLERGKLEQRHVRKVTQTLSIVPGSMEMKGVDVVLAGKDVGQIVLREALRNQQVGEWDYVVVDCPPALGMATLNAFCAADFVLAPVTPTAISLEGLAPLEKALAQCQRVLGAKAYLLGCVIFGADESKRQLQVVREAVSVWRAPTLASKADLLLYESEIRRSAAGEELFPQNLLAWGGADKRGAEDYGAVLRETIRRMEAA